MSRSRFPLRELLNADFVRRLALPLRTRRPGLYSRLNRMRKSILAGGDDLDAYQANALDRFRRRAELAGARVLEIGSDLQLRALRFLVAQGSRRAVGVNRSPDFWSARRPPAAGAFGVGADATELPFAESSFDLVFAVAVFEHLLDLPQALDEMHRVLVPGGLVHASFGPIWSAGKGHHLSIRVDGEELRHFIPEKNPLPDFCHLLITPEQLRAGLRNRVAAAWVEPIVEWVYSSTAINRLFFHQYLEIFERSPFRLASLRPERDPVQRQLRRILELRHPSERGFDVTNAEVVLVKEPSR